jgi:hypothetical protein
MDIDNRGEIIMYQTEDGLTKIGDSTCRNFRQV